MKDYEKKTLDTYNETAQDFFDSTVGGDMTSLCNHFLECIKTSLPNEAAPSILDLGCGSGRDTKYFLTKGCQVTAVDGSAELCRLASEYTGIEVINQTFEELDYEEAFDGVWACASLLHVAKEDMHDMICRIERALKSGGVFYTCFKNGSSEEFRGGRYYSDYSKDAVAELFADTNLQLQETFLTGDVRDGRDSEQWVNIIAVKLR